MKKLIRAVSGGVALSLLGVSLAAAQDTNLPGTGWWTSAGIQNVGAGQTEVVLTAYSLSGSTTTTSSSNTFNLPKDGSVTFIPGAGNATAGLVDLNPPLSSGFVGSMVVSSLEPLVAIAQVGNNQITAYGVGVANGFASAQYRGSSEGSTTIGYPLVKNNFGGKTTTFYIQSTGATANITATIVTNDGVSHTRTASIEANKTIVIDPDAGFTPAVSSTGSGDPNQAPNVGSLTIVSSTPIVGTVIEHATTTSGPATAAQSTSLFPSDAGDTTVSCPVFKNTFVGRFTGITVQNTSSATQTINAKFVQSLGGTGTFNSSLTAGPGASVTFDARSSNVGGFPANGYGTAEFTSAGTLIAIVNESNPASTPPQKQTTYSCFNTKATAKIALPQVKKNFPLSGGVVGPNTSTTGVSVQNVGTATVDVDAAFVCTNGSTYNPDPAESNSLAPGAGFTYFNPTGVDDGRNCAVTLTAAALSGQTGTVKIVAVAQESTPRGSLDTKNYEGFGLQ